MKLVIAADPFAVDLKDAVAEHLIENGHEVTDVGATAGNDIPYFTAAQNAARMLQNGTAERAILFCGTGMGMSIVANKHRDVVAACVESVFAAKMCRAVNNANALCLGAMIWGPWMAIEAVDVFLSTAHTQGLEQFADFLKMAVGQVSSIDFENLKD